MGQQVGDQFGNYRLLRKLGEGGFSEVWLGKHKIDQREAAVKVLNVLLPSPDEQEKFLNEARHLGRLDDPHIIKLLDCGIQGDQPFLILEYAPNGTLRQKHPRGSILPLNLIVNYVKQITSGLQYAHDKRIIHRDIKPENMLLNSRNQVLLSDFGIALPGQTLPYPKTQDIMGTTGYMAPEQLDGHPALATDQYALAVVVYEWLCGSLPFKGSPIDIRLQQQKQLPAQMKKVGSISPALEQVLTKALSEQVGDRYRRVQDFAEALEQAVNDPNALLNQPTFSPPQQAPVNPVPSKNPPVQGNMHQGGAANLPVPPEGNNPVTQPLPGGQPAANPQASPLAGSPQQGTPFAASPSNPQPSPFAASPANPQPSPFVGAPASPASPSPFAGTAQLGTPFGAPPANHNLPPPNNPMPDPNQGYQPLPTSGQPIPPFQAQAPIRLSDQLGNDPFSGLGSPFVAQPDPNAPQKTLHSAYTMGAPSAVGGNPFTAGTPSPTNTAWSTGKYTASQAKWYTSWITPRFYKESRNQLFLYGGGAVDFILAVALGILLNVPAVESGWYVWFFSLILALGCRALCAMLKKRWYAFFFALCLGIYWFMGSWALGIDIRNVMKFEPAPPLIIAFIVVIVGLILHIQYVLKNKRVA